MEVAGDGETALDRLVEKRERFDVVVLDVMLPGKAVFFDDNLREKKVCADFDADRARASKVMLQGFAAEQDDYLPKPFELAILIARLESLLRRSVWMKATDRRARNPARLNPPRTLIGQAGTHSILSTSAAKRLTLGNWNCARWEIQSI